MMDASKFENPDWDSGGRVHNWRNHVPEEVRAIWNTFRPAQKEALYRWADSLASDEEWE